MNPKSKNGVPEIDAELEQMRESLIARKKRLRRDRTYDGEPTSSRPSASGGSSEQTEPLVTRKAEEPLPTKVITRTIDAGAVPTDFGKDVRVPVTERLEIPTTGSKRTKGAVSSAPKTESPPEARWLDAAHRAWKSQTAELLRDRADAEKACKQMRAELESAHKAWKSQVAELLARAGEAETKVAERERWLESAHRAWKSQTAELLRRLEQAEAAPAPQDHRLAEELATLRTQLYEEQLRHIEELEGVHQTYLKRAQQVDAAHFRVVDDLRHEKTQAVSQRNDALRLADQLNARIQQMELAQGAVRAESPPKKPTKPAAKRKKFVDAPDAVPTVIAAPPPKPPRP